MKLTIATRQSPLALWQANFIKDSLIKLYPALVVELLTMSTKGDRILDTPLAKIGGKGLFVKELEQALLDGRADIAVHSLKDVPMQLPEGLVLPVFCTRHNPTDAFVSTKFAHIDDLPKGSKLGTSSLRRQSQLLAHRPDLNVQSLRGNVGTRLKKLENGEYDAIVLATSGLMRLQLFDNIRHEIDQNISLPAAGQGILAIECRNNTRILEKIAPLNDRCTQVCAYAERALNRTLDGGCQVPIAALAHVQNDVLSLQGRVGEIDGSVLLKHSQSTMLKDLHDASNDAYNKAQAENLGQAVAKNLLGQGADKILQRLYGAHA